MRTQKQIQQEVDKLIQQRMDRMRAIHEKAQAEIQEQIEEYQRQAELCRKRLLELDS